MNNLPLVSVGIPTYNRPEGLRKTLECITQQTYKNLEIIISDNNSSNLEVVKILEEFKTLDKRIICFQQTKNTGAAKNFHFVLKKAKGLYFMWASDDDIRELDCIEYYISHIGNASAIFSTYAIRNTRTLDFIIGKDLPMLSGVNNKKDLAAFIYSLCPSMIYGLFTRKSLDDIYEDVGFDWADCFLLIKYISRYGYKTVFASAPKYFAGIDGEDYIVKPANNSYLNPWIFFIKCLPYVIPLGYYPFKQHKSMCLNAWRNRHYIIRKLL